MSSSVPIPHRSNSSSNPNPSASSTHPTIMSNRQGKRPVVVTDTPSPPSHSSFSSSNSSVRQGKMPAAVSSSNNGFGGTPAFGAPQTGAGGAYGESPGSERGGVQYEDVFGKRRVRSPREELSPRRASLLGEGLLRTEHIVVNVGEEDRPRLMCCVSSSQGFDWNRSIFLPRYLASSYGDGFDDGELERRQDPIEDIVVTDEEASMMFPQ